MNVNQENNSKWIKTFAILIPLAIFGYLIYVNLLVDQEFNYFYDIGSDSDSVKPYLGPLNRTSNITFFEDTNYRDINHRLIYFSIPETRGITTLDAGIKLKGNVSSSIVLGIKNNIGWNYTWTEFDNKLNYESNWIILQKTFSLEKAYPENNKLSLSIDVPQLLKESQNATYSIDWINITVYKPAIWRKK